MTSKFNLLSINPNSLSESDGRHQEREFGELYLDMDGVLADFESVAQKLLKAKNFPNLSDNHWVKNPGELWEYLISSKNFWENLPMLPEGKRLWRYVREYKPNILSAYPDFYQKEAVEGKKKWLELHIGSSNLGTINIVSRKEKAKFAMSHGKQNVLVDDFVKNIVEFNAAGGIGIQFINSTQAINQLKSIGF